MSTGQDDTAESAALIARAAAARRRTVQAEAVDHPKDLPAPAEVLTAWEGRVPQPPAARIPVDLSTVPKVIAPPSARQLAEITELADKLDLPMVAASARVLRIDAAADLVDSLRSAAAEPPDTLTTSKSWANYAEQWSGEHPARVGRHGVADPAPKHAAGPYSAAVSAPAGLTAEPVKASAGPDQSGPAPAPGRSPNLDSARRQQQAPARAPRVTRR